MCHIAWPARLCLVLGLTFLTACARGVSTYEAEGNPAFGAEGGVLDAGADAGSPPPVMNGMDSGLPPVNTPDAGNPPPPPPPPDDAGQEPDPQDPRPVLTDIDPSSSVLNPASDVNLTLLGSGFVSRSVAQADGNALATTFVSSTELRAVIPKTLLTSIRTLRITVYTSAPGGGVSATSRDFRVVMSVPMLSMLSPAYTDVGSPATELLATGSGFESGAVLVFDNTDVTASSVSSTELRATVPASQFTTGRTVMVRVKNPGSGGGTSAARTFEVRNKVCTLSGLTPAAAVLNTQTTLQVMGQQLVSGSTVRINSQPTRTPSAATGTSLTVTIPATDVSSIGNVTLTVSVPAPNTPGSNTCSISWPVQYAVPAITSFGPNPITVGANDTLLTVTGTGFVVGSSVIQLDGVSATTTCVSTTQCRTTLPAAFLATGKTVSVTVVNPAPGGGASNAVSLAINYPSPVLTSLTPTFVAEGSPDTTLTLSGSGYVQGSQVRLTPKAGGAASLYTPATRTATQLTVTLPAALLATAAAYDVSIENPSPNPGPSATRPFTVWAGNCPLTGVDLPIASTGVVTDYDLSWTAATTSTGIYAGSSSCGNTLNANVKRKFRTVVVQNNSPNPIVLSSWAKCAANDSAWLAYYKGTTIPTSDDQLRMCTGKIGQGVGIYGAPAADSAGSVGCPGLLRSDNASIRLEACESVVVYMQMQTTQGAGPAKLRVRADAP